jgi:hypothetical protein
VDKERQVLLLALGLPQSHQLVVVEVVVAIKIQMAIQLLVVLGVADGLWTHQPQGRARQVRQIRGTRVRRHRSHLAGLPEVVVAVLVQLV